MATTLSDFCSDIAIHVPGCPGPAMENAVRNALIEFCTDTLIWREAQDPEDVPASNFPFDIPAPKDAVITTVLHVFVDGTRLDPEIEEALDLATPNWRTQAAGVPEAYTLSTPTTLVLTPPPANTVQLLIVAAYAPSRTANTVPSFIYQKYAETIAAGALARLFVIPGKSWTQPALAGPWLSVFNAGKAKASADVELSFARPTLRIRTSPL